jgi:hypothetical protein
MTLESRKTAQTLIIRGAILLAMTVSATKLFQVCTTLTRDERLAGTTATIFWATCFVLQIILITRSRKRLFALFAVYTIKIVVAGLLTLGLHAQSVESQMPAGQASLLNSSGVSHFQIASVAQGSDWRNLDTSTLARMIVFLLSAWPPQLILELTMTFFAIFLGDICALLLEAIAE